MLCHLKSLRQNLWSAHGATTATALSVGGQIMRIAVELSTVLGIGAVILISQQLGRGEDEAARKTAEVACVANGVAGLGIGLVLAIAGPLALGLMALGSQIEEGARDYLYYSAIAATFLCFGNAAVACLRGFGMSRAVMVLGVFGAILYLALEYLLVLGAGPVPAFGAAGAGAANMLTRAIFALILAVVVIKLLNVRLRISSAWHHFQQVKRMIALALPSVSDFIAYGFYQMILIGFISTQGDIEVLSRAYVMIAMAFLTLVIMAIVQGTEVLIGYRIGAGDRRAAQDQSLYSASVAALLSSLCAVLIYLCAGPFIALFTADPEVTALCRYLLWLTIFLQPCFAINMIYFHVLRAVEDVRRPVLMSQALSWCFGLPLAWFFCIWAGWGAVGVWYALIAEELVKAGVMYGRWRQISRTLHAKSAT